MTTKVPASMTVEAVTAAQLAAKADTSALATKADDSAVVHNTGDESVAGTKTFTKQPVLPQAPVLTASQATTSGTSKDFTGIPSWVRRITICLTGVSLSGTALLLVQIGSGSVDATGYSGCVGNASNFTNFSTGFMASNYANAAVASHGIVTLVLADASTNTWVMSGCLGLTGVGCAMISGGSKALSGTLDRVRLTSNGADTFDAGSVSVRYE